MGLVVAFLGISAALRRLVGEVVPPIDLRLTGSSRDGNAACGLVHNGCVWRCVSVGAVPARVRVWRVDLAVDFSRLRGDLQF